MIMVMTKPFFCTVVGAGSTLVQIQCNPTVEPGAHCFFFLLDAQCCGLTTKPSHLLRSVEHMDVATCIFRSDQMPIGIFCDMCKS